jgi:hypothetical protein
MSNDQAPDGIRIEHYAALVFALAVARGALYSVRNGDLETDELERVLAGTSSTSIALALAVSEDRLTIDWERHLTTSQRDTIQGR